MVIPYTAVVTAETGVKKWSRRGQVVFPVSVKLSGQDAIEEGEATGVDRYSQAVKSLFAV